MQGGHEGGETPVRAEARRVLDHQHEQRGRHGDEDLASDDDPRAVERPVEPCEDTTRTGAGCRPMGHRGGTRRCRSRRASARTCRSSRRTPRGSGRARSRGREGGARRTLPPPGGRRRVVSVARCRPRLRNGTQWSRATSNDRSTTRCGRHSARCSCGGPAGLTIAALMRPPDAAAGETDEERWLERAREAVTRGPLRSPHALHEPDACRRPTDGDTGPRVLREGAWLRERGLAPSVFCGGGWYTDRSVALACADLGYVDCTPRRGRPSYLEDGAAWAELE